MVVSAEPVAGYHSIVDGLPTVIESRETSLPPAVDDDVGVYALRPENALPRRIAHWAEIDHDRPFLQEVNGRHATYGQLWSQARRCASLLRGLGVRRGDRIVTMLPASIDAYALWLGAGCIGALEVPVNPDLRGSFLDHALADPGASLCFVRPEFAAVPGCSAVAGLSVIEVPRDGSLTGGVAEAELGDLPLPADPSCVIYTSGTTGPSKGVIVSWAQMAATVGRIPRSWLGPTDAGYACHPIFHITGRSPLPVMAECGGRIVIREKLSVGEFWNDVRTHGCTTTTVLAGLMLAAPERPNDLENPLRFGLLSGGRAAAVRFGERFGVHMIECYGSTEVGFPIVQRELTLDNTACGRLRRGYRARVITDEGQPAAVGASGELWIHSPAAPLITLGYLNQPESTAKAIVDGWYRTGDRVARVDHEMFQFVDRMRDTIRRLGENISSVALEAVVQSDEEVAECAAIGVPDEATGQMVLVAVVANEGAPPIDPEALHHRLQQVLPKYMVPSIIAVCDSLPKTPTGKCRKAGLVDELDLESAWHAPTRPR